MTNERNDGADVLFANFGGQIIATATDNNVQTYSQRIERLSPRLCQCGSKLKHFEPMTCTPCLEKMLSEAESD